MRMLLNLLIVLGASPAWANGLEEAVYPKCYQALNERIQSYCNCEIRGQSALVLTGVGGLQAAVGIEKNVDGLPEVAWVLNQVNKSGHPGTMTTYIDQKTWVIEENVRMWDLQPSEKGLTMSKAIRVKRQFNFEINDGNCRLAKADLELKAKKQKAKVQLSKDYCQSYDKGKHPASHNNFKSEIKKECDLYLKLESTL